MHANLGSQNVRPGEKHFIVDDMNFTIGHNRIRITDNIFFQGIALSVAQACDSRLAICNLQSRATEIHMSSQGRRLSEIEH